jgi:hypothetical protein
MMVWSVTAPASLSPIFDNSDINSGWVPCLICLLTHVPDIHELHSPVLTLRADVFFRLWKEQRGYILRETRKIQEEPQESVLLNLVKISKTWDSLEIRPLTACAPHNSKRGGPGADATAIMHHRTVRCAVRVLKSKLPCSHNVIGRMVNKADASFSNWTNQQNLRSWLVGVNQKANSSSFAELPVYKISGVITPENFGRETRVTSEFQYIK